MIAKANRKKDKNSSRDRLLKVSASTYLDPGPADRLDKLAARTRIGKAELLREAVDLLLAKHEAGAGEGGRHD